MEKISLTVNRKKVLRFLENPSLSSLVPQVGDTLTINPGRAGPEPNTITVDSLVYNGSDKKNELSGFDWDTTGETVYGTSKSIVVRLLSSASNNFQTRLSETLTAKLVDVPDAFVLSNWDADDDGANGIDVTINSLPDNGGLTITSLEYRIDSGSWTSTGGNTNFNIPNTGSITSLEIRAVNSLGAGGESDTKSPTVSAGTSENGVVIADGTHLRAPQLPPATTRSMLFFFSGTQNASLDARSALCSIDGVTTSIHAQFGDGAGTTGVRASFYDSAVNRVLEENRPVTIGDRYHLLLSLWTDDTNHNLRAYIWTGGSWSSALSQTTSTSASTTLDLATRQMELFRFASSSKQFWAGTCNRMAMWLSDTGSEIADISSSTVQNNFTSGGNVIAASTSVTAYGTPVWDFNGTASDWNSGVHTGSWSSFTKFGPTIENASTGGSTGTAAVIIDPPTIEGNTAVGSTLSVSAGPTEGTEPITTVLELYRDGSYVQDVGETYTTTSSDAETVLTVFQRSSNIYNTEEVTSESDPFTVDAISTDTTAPVWSTNRPTSVEYDAANDRVAITHTIIEADSLPLTVYAVLLTGGADAPNVTQIKDGQDSTGSAAVNANWTHAINQTKNTAASADVSSGTFDLYMVATDDASNDSTVEAVTGIVIGENTTSLAFSSIVTIAATDPPPVSTGDFTFTLTGQTGPGGDVIVLESSENDRTEGWKPAYYEWRIDNGDGTYTEGRSVNAETSATGVKTYFRAVNPGSGNDIQIRQVDKKLTTIYVQNLTGTSPNTDVAVSDTIYNQSGDSATVDEIIYWNGGSEFSYGIRRLIVSNVIGEWAREENIYIDDGAGGLQQVGKQGKQEILPRYNPPSSEISEGAWSTVETITPTIGTSTVVVTTKDGRSTYTEGESVAIVVEPKGFSSDVDEAGRMYPFRDLNYRCYVDKTGEESIFTHLSSDFPYGRDQTEYFGPDWSYRPKTTGSVTLYCEVWENDDYANRQTGSVTVTMTPKTTKFTAGNTFVVDPDGLYTDAPTASNQYTTIDAAVTALKSGSSGISRRLSLANGHTYSPTNLTFSDLDVICIDTYGSGSRAVIANPETNPAQINVSGCGYAILEGFKILGDYDSATPDDMTYNNQHQTDGIQLGTCGYSTIYNVMIDGLGRHIRLGKPETISNIVNSHSTNWGDFSIFEGDTGAFYIIGTYNKQKATAVRAPGRATSNSGAPWAFDHSSGRCSRPTDVYVIGMSDFSDIGGHGDRLTQSVWRHWGAPDENQIRISVMMNRMVCGVWSIWPTTSRSFCRPQNMRVEFNHLASTGCWYNVMFIAITGVTCRNNVFLWEDIPTEFKNGHRDFIGITLSGNDGIASETEHAPIVFEFNSLINLKSGANRDNSWSAINTSPSNVFPNVNPTIENNLEHSPSYVDGVDSSPLDNTAEWSPYYQGGYFWDGSILAVSGGNGTQPLGDSGQTVTDDTSQATGVIRYRSKINKTYGDWGSGTGVMELTLNATTTGVFGSGNTVTFSNGATATVDSYIEGDYDDAVPFSSAHTNASCSWYRPLSGSPALSGLETAAGRSVPYFDASLNIRRRDGTTARGALESA